MCQSMMMDSRTGRDGGEEEGWRRRRRRRDGEGGGGEKEEGKRRSGGEGGGGGEEDSRTGSYRDADRSASRCELQGVRDEVSDDLIHLELIHTHTVLAVEGSIIKYQIIKEKSVK